MTEAAEARQQELKRVEGKGYENLWSDGASHFFYSDETEALSSSFDSIEEAQRALSHYIAHVLSSHKKRGKWLHGVRLRCLIAKKARRLIQRKKQRQDNYNSTESALEQVKLKSEFSTIRAQNWKNALLRGGEPEEARSWPYVSALRAEARQRNLGNAACDAFATEQLNKAQAEDDAAHAKAKANFEDAKARLERAGEPLP